MGAATGYYAPEMLALAELSRAAGGKAGIGISFAPDMDGYQIIQSMAPQGTAASSGPVLVV